MNGKIPLSSIRASDVFIEGNAVICRNEYGRKFENHDKWEMLEKFDNLGDIRSALERCKEQERDVASCHRFAWSPEFGYLSPIPAHCGLGISLSVGLHLEGLAQIGEFNPVLDGCEAIRLIVSGAHIDGISYCGHFLVLGNNSSMGVTEEELMEKFLYAINGVIKQELNARKRLLTEMNFRLKDAIMRSIGILQNACILNHWELMDLISPLLLAANLKLFSGFTAAGLRELMVKQFKFGEFPKRSETLEEDHEKDLMEIELANKIRPLAANFKLSKLGEEVLR